MLRYNLRDFLWMKGRIPKIEGIVSHMPCFQGVATLTWKPSLLRLTQMIYVVLKTWLSKQKRGRKITL